MEESFGFRIYEILTFFDLCSYKEACNWPIFNIDIFYMFRDMGYKFYLLEKEGFHNLKSDTSEDYPYDNYSLSLLLIMMKDGVIESIYSRRNQDDILEKYLNPLQLSNLLEDEFYNFIIRYGICFKPHVEVTGMKGRIFIPKRFGEYDPIIIFEFRGRKGAITIGEKPEFSETEFRQFVPRPIGNKLKRWIIHNEHALIKYWNRDITNFFGMHRLRSL